MLRFVVGVYGVYTCMTGVQRCKYGIKGVKVHVPWEQPTERAMPSLQRQCLVWGEKGRREGEKERGYRTKERTKQDETGRRGRMRGG